MKPTTCVALVVACFVACLSFAKDAPKANAYTKSLSAVPSAELPAKAAELVLQAKPAALESTTVQVVKGALAINPAAAPAIVASIARAVPKMASIAAGAAAAEQPKQAAAIAKAAAAAVPAQAAAIVTAVCRAVPNDYVNIASAASQAVPGAKKEIVQAVGAALPQLKAPLDKVLAGYGGNVVSVSSTLAQASQITTTTADTTTTVRPMLARGPSVGTPYIGLTTTPTNVSSGASGEVPPGGRDYAAP